MANNGASVRFRTDAAEFKSSIKALNSAMFTLRSAAKPCKASYIKDLIPKDMRRADA